ncbi:MAG TPA: MerR family transcriptional regulator [Oculatellaceae cyanobacterium]
MSSPMFSVNTENEALTIGALAKLCGVTVRTLRYYEELDLIAPTKRSAGRYRLYNHHAVKRVNAILALQGLNFSLEEIATILGQASQMRQYTKSQQIEHTRESLARQQQFIQEKISQLKALSQDIDARMKALDSVCRPCAGHESDETCSENCAYYEVHN